MNRLAVSIGVVVVALSAVAIGRLAAQHAAEPAPAAITIDYPAQDSIFPPDMVAPTFLWRDPAKTAAVWRIDIDVRRRLAGHPFESAGRTDAGRRDRPARRLLHQRAAQADARSRPKIAHLEAGCRNVGADQDAARWQARL